MRVKTNAIFDFGTAIVADNKTVRDYRNEYKALAEILDRQPMILDRVHRDLAKLTRAKSKRGRKAIFTSENLFRAILVMQREGLDYREASVRIAESETLQNFCRLIKKPTIDFTLLNKAFGAIEPETWELINHILGLQAVEEGIVTIEHLRTDTTVTECDIHWPTDSSLLWDVYRVVAREMSKARSLGRIPCTYRFHPKKAKKLYLDVTRYARSSARSRKRQVDRAIKSLIERTEKAIESAEDFVQRAKTSGDVELIASLDYLESRLPVMRQAASVARRRAFDNEKVPNDEKVFSIFEPHAELIMRGRRGKPIEFGHKVLLTQSREKFITDYLVLEANCSDSQLLSPVLQRHVEKYGRMPETIAGDKGFCPDADDYEELEDQLEFLGVPRRTRDFGDKMMGIWQQWRAGIEGTISCLKRAFRLARCCFRGFKNFASAIGSAVFCHNLTVLAKLESG